MPPTTTETRVTVGADKRAAAAADSDPTESPLGPGGAAIARGAAGMVMDNPLVKGAAAVMGGGDPGKPLGKAYIASAMRSKPTPTPTPGGGMSLKEMLEKKGHR